MRAGAAYPDVGSVAAFRRALLEAKSVAYTLTGQSGVYFASVIERLGIAAEIRVNVPMILSGASLTPHWTKKMRASLRWFRMAACQSMGWQPASPWRGLYFGGVNE